MGLVVTLFACFLTKESELDKVSEFDGKTDSDFSTSLENYEEGVRRELIAMGEPATSVNQREIPKRDGFCYNLKKNC